MALQLSYHRMREKLRGGRLPGLPTQGWETAGTWPGQVSAALGSQCRGCRSLQTCPEGGRSQPPGCQGLGLADLAGLAQNKGREPHRRGCGAWRGSRGLLLHSPEAWSQQKRFV